jgi:hypothetical protein
MVADALEHVFGASPGRLVDAFEIQSRALTHNSSSWNGDSSSCAHYADRYLGREDVFVALCEHAVEATGVSDLFHVFLDAVVAAVPFRHEAFVVEIASPHRLWFVDNGAWSLAADALFAKTTSGRRRVEPPDDVLHQRRARAGWLFPLLPKWIHLSSDTRDLRPSIRRREARPAWARDGAPDARELLRRWGRSDRGCADTLAALWGTFFLGARDAFEQIAEAAAAHPAAAVRSSGVLARRVDAGDRSPIHDALRANRAAFLAAGA